MNEVRFADMFCGIGGFRLGLERAIINSGKIPVCATSSEIEKNAVRVYEKNFEETPAGDIRRIDENGFPDVDILCGGFPCQGASYCGKRKGLHDERTGLFYDLIRIAEKARPRIIFLENVRGLLSANRGWDFARVLIALDEIGYSVQWQLLNSKDFGVPQNRERVYIVGYLGDRSPGEIFPISGSTGATTRENSSTAIDANYWKGCDNHGQRTQIIHLADAGRNRSIQVRDGSTPPLRVGGGAGPNIYPVMQYYGGDHQQDRFLDPAGICSCLSARSGGNQMPKVITIDDVAERKPDKLGRMMPIHRAKINLDGSRIRRLTPVECERLQGYPDNWTAGISDTMRYKCLGNAVTVPVIEAISRKIMKTEMMK